MILLKNVKSPGIVNQTPRSIRSYIGDIFTPNPTFLLTLLTRKSWFTSSHTSPNPRYFFHTHVTRSNDSFIYLIIWYRVKTKYAVPTLTTSYLRS
jgi:hypothetical protein